MLHGIDVSNWQGSVDWARYAKAGDAFAFAKATEGLTYRDVRFAGNWSGMRAHGLIRGAYHFAHPGNDAEKEAAFFLAEVRAHGLHDGDLLALDLEVDDGKAAAHVAAYARGWCAYVHKHAGCRPLVYANISYARGGYCAGLGDYPLWLAAPSYRAGGPPVPVGPWHDWTLHQYSSDPLDKDVFNGSSVAAMRALGVGGQEDDVPIRTSLGKDKDQALHWGRFTVLDWDVEHADPGKAHSHDNPGYVAPVSSWADLHVQARVDGLKPGDYWQVEFRVHDWKDGKATSDWTEIAADFPATRGDQFVTASLSKHLKKGQHVHVAAKVMDPGGPGGRPAPKAVHGRWTIAQDRA